MKIIIKVKEHQTPDFGEFMRMVLLADNINTSERCNNREYLEMITKAINAYALAVASNPDTCTEQASFIAAELGTDNTEN